MRHDTFVLFAETPIRNGLSGPRPTGAAIHAIGRFCNGKVEVECVHERAAQVPSFGEDTAAVEPIGTKSLIAAPRVEGFSPSIAEKDAENADAAVRSSLAPGLADGVHAAVKRLGELGYRGQPLLLALGANLCLCGTISAKGLPPRNRRQAMLYRFEELVPMAAEQFVADCAVQGDWAYGVCVETARLLPLLETLEQGGVAVQHVCPAGLLAAQLALRENKGFDVIMWSTASPVPPAPREAGQPQSTNLAACRPTPVETDSLHDAMELVAVYQDQPRAWHEVTGGSAMRLRPYLGAIAQIVGRPPRVLADALSRRVIGPSPLLVGNGSNATVTADSAVASFRVTTELTPEAVLDAPSLMSEPVATPLLEGVVRAAELVLGGSLRLWIDLRRDALAASDRYRAVRLPLAAAYAAAVCLTVIACIALLWRAHRYSQMTAAYENRQASLFQVLFPNQGNPGLVRPRLESEEQRLLGLGGEASDLPPQPSAILLLHQALSRLPADLRYRILSLRLTDNRLYVEGQARTHGDAERIAAALRTNGGFRVEPPRTELLPPGGVAFTLNCVADLTSLPKAIAAPLPLGGSPLGPVDRQHDAVVGGQNPAADGRIP